MPNPLTICCFPITLRENKVLDLIYGPLRDMGLRLKPYHWLFSMFSRVDVFHVHWPDAAVTGTFSRVMIKLGLFLGSVLIFRLRRVPIVYTVHNIQSHDRSHPRLERLLWRVFLPRVSAFTHMSQASLDAFLKWQPGLRHCRHVLLPHPLYPRSTPRRERSAYSDDRPFQFISFGLVRAYKGLEDLIGAFRGLTGHNLRLRIIGRAPDPAYEKTIRDLASGDHRIQLDLTFFSDEALDHAIDEADVITICHRWMNNSGVAIRALSSGSVLLAPKHPAMLELQQMVGSDQVRLYDDGGLMSALQACAEMGHVRHSENLGNLAAFEPAHIAREFAKLFNSLLPTDSFRLTGRA